MDWFQFLSSIAASLAWPVAAIVMVHQLRTPLGKLIPLIRSMKYKELQIDLATKLETVEHEVAATGVTAEQSSSDEAFELLAEMDPRAAISAAWIPLQTEIYRQAKLLGITSLDVYSPLGLVGLLQNRGAIPKEVADSIVELSDIRSSAAHAEEGSVSILTARRMIRLCTHMAELLKEIEIQKTIAKRGCAQDG